MPRGKPFAILLLTAVLAVAISGCMRSTRPAPIADAGSPQASRTQSYQPKSSQAYEAKSRSVAQARRAEIVKLPRRKPPVPGQARAPAGRAPVMAPAASKAVAQRPVRQVAGIEQRSDAAPPPAKPAAAAPKRRVASAGIYYVTVKDTLYSISRRFQIPLRSLIEANGLNPPYNLRVGQKVTLPRTRTYTVQKGDTVYGISRRNGVDMSELMRLNGIEPPYTISVGQALRMPDATGGGTQMVAAAVGGSGLAAATAPKAQAAVPQAPASPASPSSTPDASGQAPAQPVAALGPVPNPPPRQGSKFLWPVDGKVVSAFGPKGKGYHNDGINIMAPRGSDVRAAESGVVAYAGNELRGFGNLVLVKHAGGWTTAYAHNEQIVVRRGQTVQRGQLIAKVGSSGNVAEPQLHFEIRKGSRAVDPRRLLAPKDAKVQ